ncbi:MAG: hypothetical protein OET44_20475 [Gammaproteobacteria bacterium]|nr:hypothetical protein [Gammaproteobacteria bacterium]
MTRPIDNAEIDTAVALLERAESEFPSQQSADSFSEAFDALNDIIAYDSPGDSVSRYISNVKYAHCRRIATRLVEVDPGDFEVWFHYAVLLLVKMKIEFDTLRIQHPDLGLLYDRCMGRHGTSLQAAAAKLADGR